MSITVIVLLICVSIIVGFIIHISFSNKQRYKKRYESEEKRKQQEIINKEKIEKEKAKQEEKFQQLLKDHQDALNRLRNIKSNEKDKPFTNLSSLSEVEKYDYTQIESIREKLENGEPDSNDKRIIKDLNDSSTPLDD
jgi:biopolymer transport protein ExbB/TolQ